jgi:hypothetical protein
MPVWLAVEKSKFALVHFRHWLKAGRVCLLAQLAALHRYPEIVDRRVGSAYALDGHHMDRLFYLCHDPARFHTR